MYEYYLDEAIDLGIFRYITKPIDDDRFFRGIKAAVKYYHYNTQIVTFEYYNKCYSIFTSDILYITTENQKAVIITQKSDILQTEELVIGKTD